MIAIGSEKLLEIIIGTGQVRHPIAGKEPGPVTAGDFTKVPQRWGECARGALVSRHCAQDSPETTLHRQHLALVCIAEDMGCLMDPAIPYPYVGPQSSRVPQASRQQAFQPLQFLGQGPLFSTRAILA